MSLLAEFEARSPEFVLGPTFEAVPSLVVEIERLYALDPDRPIAFCWTTCRDRDRLEEALEADGTIDQFERIAERTDRTLYRLRRSDSGVIQAYRQWVAAGGELLDCRGCDANWEVEMRFPDRESFVSYHAFLEDERVEFELHRLASGADAQWRDAGGTVTDSQREALEIAYERGFFDVPRETTLAAIADVLEISPQAVSERLRRGQARLIEENAF
ncbi:helix-turn-helix domain-containing protein [Natrarchaeobius oligotrophus]|uniref:Bacterio-opsin activator n=1 Tax=Natrarchaeobius chitinivorans TaxID=1679083 RepID=A0A3N6PQ65_NATCH|nr:helix-turn-helix domain-containing protein [Natrarchaeobius chitinivorans]RQH01386.1 bacterio-opsin activator [Natrarchaeobius chitinivorans]